MPDIVDWDSTHEGVESASFHYEDEHTTMKDDDVDNVEIHIHTHEGSVRLIGYGGDEDRTNIREFSVDLTPAEAELIGKQLYVAAREYGYDGTNADIRT